MRVRWAVEGGGTTSTIDWMTQVESESHWVKMSCKRPRPSFDFSSRGGILRFSVETILDTLSGLLKKDTHFSGFI